MHSVATVELILAISIVLIVTFTTLRGLLDRYSRNPSPFVEDYEVENIEPTLSN